MNIDWDAILKVVLPILLEGVPLAVRRLFVILFSTLGVVYFSGRLIAPKKIGKRDDIKNRIAAIALVVLSYGLALVKDYPGLIDSKFASVPWQYVATGFVYAMFGTVFYVIVGWRFYSRMDRWFDKKWAPDQPDRRKR